MLSCNGNKRDGICFCLQTLTSVRTQIFTSVSTVSVTTPKDRTRVSALMAGEVKSVTKVDLLLECTCLYCDFFHNDICIHSITLRYQMYNAENAAVKC